MASRPLSVDEFAEITMGRHQWLDMDPLTFSKIIEVQLENVEHLSSRAKGKQRDGTVKDARLALQVCVDHAGSSNDTISDHMVAEDVATASLRDVPAIEEAVRRGHRIDQDYEFASKLAGGRLARVNRRSMMQELQQKETDPLKELWPALIDSDSEESLVAAESSTWAAAENIRESRSKRRCVACAEERLIRDLATVPCKHKHEYCRDCLSRVVELAIEDESFFPPTCDGEVIPVENFSTFLPRSLIDQYQSKGLEYETKDRIYCYESTCAAFIPPASIDGVSAMCAKCCKTTCTISSGHFGDRVGDEAMRQLEETANMKRWRRCHMCNSIVQLEHGHSHITCCCVTQLCYAHGAKWKSCNCEHWEEDSSLYQGVTHFVDKPPPLPPRHAKKSSTIRRSLRRPLAGTDLKASMDAIGRHVTAPRYSLSRRPTVDSDVPSSNPTKPGLFAGRTQCAIQ